MEKRPLLYVTCTVGQGTIRLDGRLQGTEHHPQKIVLSVSQPNRETLFQETVETDEHGYFELVRPDPGPLPESLLARAEWNGVKGTAAVPAQ